MDHSLNLNLDHSLDRDLDRNLDHNLDRNLDRNIAQKLLLIKGEGVWRIARHCAHRQPIQAGGGADLPYGGKKAEIQAVTVIPCHV